MQHLCSLQHQHAWTNVPTLTKSCVFHRLRVSLLCPSVQRDFEVEYAVGVGGRSQILSWSYQSAPSLFPVSTLWQTNTRTCPGS
ncbi:hypothetical protein PBY51_001558 [Eleginops maclovinus]|uniref:Uncharacterized protein n=1 Tax=Eleginops maclovinus TaxID=56733 RepID=A0AAN7WYM0_ELEMC|nr:hypothetical protein PBY51_001558 [Eleginops maclovinus]